MEPLTALCGFKYTLWLHNDRLKGVRRIERRSYHCKEIYYAGNEGKPQQTVNDLTIFIFLSCYLRRNVNQ